MKLLKRLITLILCVMLMLFYNNPVNAAEVNPGAFSSGVINFDGEDYIVNVSHSRFDGTVTVAVREKSMTNAPVEAVKYDSMSNVVWLSKSSSSNVQTYSVTEDNSTQFNLNDNSIVLYDIPVIGPDRSMSGGGTGYKFTNSHRGYSYTAYADWTWYISIPNRSKNVSEFYLNNAGYLKDFKSAVDNMALYSGMIISSYYTAGAAFITALATIVANTGSQLSKASLVALVVAFLGISVASYSIVQYNINTGAAVFNYSRVR